MTLNDWGSLFELAERLQRLAEANPYFIGAAHFGLGVSLLVQGRVEEGLAWTRRAREFWDRVSNFISSGTRHRVSVLRP